MANPIEVRQRELTGLFSTSQGDLWAVTKNGTPIASTSALGDGTLQLIAQFRYEVDGDTLTDAQKLALINNNQFRLIEKQ